MRFLLLILVLVFFGWVDRCAIEIKMTRWLMQYL